MILAFLAGLLTPIVLFLVHPRSRFYARQVPCAIRGHRPMAVLGTMQAKGFRKHVAACQTCGDTFLAD